MKSYKSVDFKTLKFEGGRSFHINLEQIAIALKGNITLVLYNGKNREEIKLNNPNKGLFIEGLIWRYMKDFSPDCVLVVLASQHYDESYYIREYDKFREVIYHG